jgi:hypothetical protein
VSWISTYCHIKEGKVFHNGKLLVEDLSSGSLKDFAVKAFRSMKVNYPKFFKMDDISKLGFLAAEMLLSDLAEEPEANTGIILSNAYSTLVTDTAFQESIRDYNHFYPSPSVFVYTLPNIMIGEISIRHQFRGENAFFIFDHFNAKFLSDYINMLFQFGKMNNCIGGWVNQSEGAYEAFIYFATNRNSGVPYPDHNAEELQRLYKLN